MHVAGHTLLYCTVLMCAAFENQHHHEYNGILTADDKYHSSIPYSNIHWHSLLFITSFNYILKGNSVLGPAKLPAIDGRPSSKPIVRNPLPFHPQPPPLPLHSSSPAPHPLPLHSSLAFDASNGGQDSPTLIEEVRTTFYCFIYFLTVLSPLLCFVRVF